MERDWIASMIAVLLLTGLMPTALGAYSPAPGKPATAGDIMFMTDPMGGPMMSDPVTGFQTGIHATSVNTSDGHAIMHSDFWVTIAPEGGAAVFESKFHAHTGMLSFAYPFAEAGKHSVKVKTFTTDDTPPSDRLTAPVEKTFDVNVKDPATNIDISLDTGGVKPAVGTPLPMVFAVKEKGTGNAVGHVDATLRIFKLESLVFSSERLHSHSGLDLSVTYAFNSPGAYKIRVEAYSIGPSTIHFGGAAQEFAVKIPTDKGMLMLMTDPMGGPMMSDPVAGLTTGIAVRHDNPYTMMPIMHSDFQVKVAKAGAAIFEGKFHAHTGVLTLSYVFPSAGDYSVHVEATSTMDTPPEDQFPGKTVLDQPVKVVEPAKNIKIDWTTSPAPATGQASQLVFTVKDDKGTAVGHVDAVVSVVRLSDGFTVFRSERLHSHSGLDLATTVVFPTAAKYTVRVEAFSIGPSTVHFGGAAQEFSVDLSGGAPPPPPAQQEAGGVSTGLAVGLLVVGLVIGLLAGYLGGKKGSAAGGKSKPAKKEDAK